MHRFPAEERKGFLRQAHSLLPSDGFAAIRTLIDEGFQAFNAARLGESCRIFTDKMLEKRSRHDHRADDCRGA